MIWFSSSPTGAPVGSDHKLPPDGTRTTEASAAMGHGLGCRGTPSVQAPRGHSRGAFSWSVSCGKTTTV